MFNAGQLDRMATLLRATDVDDGLQTMPGPAVAIGSFHVSRRDVSDAERFAAGATRAAVTSRFQARWSPMTAGITTSDQLECEGRVYQIVGVKEIGRRRLIEISTRADA